MERREFGSYVSLYKILFFLNTLIFSGLDLSHFRNSIVPMISIEEYVEIDDETMGIIRENLINMETAVRIAATSGVIR